jgi:hypothetical protein
MWQQSETYPDPAGEVRDPRFLKYRITNQSIAATRQAATGSHHVLLANTMKSGSTGSHCDVPVGSTFHPPGKRQQRGVVLTRTDQLDAKRQPRRTTANR